MVTIPVSDQPRTQLAPTLKIINMGSRQQDERSPSMYNNAHHDPRDGRGAARRPSAIPQPRTTVMNRHGDYGGPPPAPFAPSAPNYPAECLDDLGGIWDRRAIDQQQTQLPPQHHPYATPNTAPYTYPQAYSQQNLDTGLRAQDFSPVDHPPSNFDQHPTFQDPYNLAADSIGFRGPPFANYCAPPDADNNPRTCSRRPNDTMTPSADGPYQDLRTSSFPTNNGNNANANASYLDESRSRFRCDSETYQSPAQPQTGTNAWVQPTFISLNAQDLGYQVGTRLNDYQYDGTGDEMRSIQDRTDNWSERDAIASPPDRSQVEARLFDFEDLRVFNTSSQENSFDDSAAPPQYQRQTHEPSQPLHYQQAFRPHPRRPHRTPSHHPSSDGSTYMNDRNHDAIENTMRYEDTALVDNFRNDPHDLELLKSARRPGLPYYFNSHFPPGFQGVVQTRGEDPTTLGRPSNLTPSTTQRNLGDSAWQTATSMSRQTSTSTTRGNRRPPRSTHRRHLDEIEPGLREGVARRRSTGACKRHHRKKTRVSRDVWISPCLTDADSMQCSQDYDNGCVQWQGDEGDLPKSHRSSAFSTTSSQPRRRRSIANVYPASNQYLSVPNPRLTTASYMGAHLRYEHDTEQGK